MVSSRAEIVTWLSRQGRKVPLVVGVRSALRIFPALSYALREASVANSAQIRRNLILPALQAGAVSWVVARYPANASALRGLADSGADSAVLGRRIARPYTDDDYSDEVIEAIATAARAAASPDFLDPSFKAIEASLTAAAPARSSEADDAEGTMLDAIAADARAIDRRVSPENVAGSPLWPGPFPDWARDRWGRLKVALRQSGEDWDGWIDWYDARLSGKASIEAVELQRVKAPVQLRLFDSTEVTGSIRGVSIQTSTMPLNALDYSGAKSTDSRLSKEKTSVPRYMTSFIEEYLEDLRRPATVAEIRSALREAGFLFRDRSVNWTLTRLHWDARHTFTDYDARLAEGYDRDSARFFVAEELAGLLAEWGVKRKLGVGE